VCARPRLPRDGIRWRAKRRGGLMGDVVFVVLIVVAFAALLLMVRAVDKL
jgi:hypothetical protein